MNNPNSSDPTSKAGMADSSVPVESDTATSEISLEVTPKKLSPTDLTANLTGHERFEDLEPLLPMADLIHTLTDYEKQRVDPDTGQVLTVEEIKVDMPIELRVSVDDAGQVSLKGAAPTQRTETTVLPVFHQMQLRIVEVRHDQER